MTEQRMYFVMLRHLSGIQKGVQATHVLAEYVLKYFNNEDFQKWAKKDKTAIFLEAHSDSELDKLLKKLKQLKVNAASFEEPDMKNCPTGVCFLLGAQVWDTGKYPMGGKNGIVDLQLRDIKNKYSLAT
jgi:Peptidyl-tRNA hydrolase PTH2